jgi:hypothetical protein
MVGESSSTYLRRTRNTSGRRGVWDWGVYSDPRGVHRPREYSTAMPSRSSTGRSWGVRSHAAPPWQAGAHTYNWVALGISGGAVVAVILLILLEAVR